MGCCTVTEKLWEKAPSGGQRVEEGRRENEKEGGEVTENLLDIDPLAQPNYL